MYQKLIIQNPKPKIQNLKLLNINQIVSETIVQLAVDHKDSIHLEDFFKIWQTSKQRKLTKSEARQISYLLAVAALATANAESATAIERLGCTEVEELNRKFLG